MKGKIQKYIDKIRNKTMDETLFWFIRHIIGRNATLKFSHFIYRICRALPLRDNIIVFRTAPDFSDNGRALYEHISIHNDKRQRFIWIVNSPKLFSNRERTIYISPNGFLWNYYMATAKNIFETHNMTMINFRKKQNYICLGHCIPVKKGKNPNKEVYTKPLFTQLIGSSTYMKPAFAGFWSCDENMVLPLGFPRNDLLVRKKSIGKDNPFASDKSYDKVVIWMPTFRASINPLLSEATCDTETGLPLLENVDSVKSFSLFCKSNNILLIIKIHRLQAGKDIFNMQFDNIIFLRDDELLERNIQLYEMIAKTDALITDYSSISMDYLLLDKPMGFILTDIEDYIESRGLVFDNFLDILPGKAIFTIDDFKAFMQKVVVNEDADKEKRDKLLPLIHDHADGNSCQRIKEYFNL